MFQRQPVQDVTGIKKLYGRNVLVKLDPLPEQKGSILLVRDKNSYQELREATVVQVSDGYSFGKEEVLIPLEVKVGDKVVCAVPEHNPCEVMVAGEKMNIIKEDFIYGVIEEGE